MKNNITADDLLNDVKRVAESLNQTLLSYQEYVRNSGKYNYTDFIRSIGSWKKALHLLGLESRQNKQFIDTKYLIADLKRVAEKMNMDNLTIAEYMNNSGKYSYLTYIIRFGTWGKAVQAAGLTYARKWRAKMTNEELIADLKRVAQIINKDSFSENDYKINGGKYNTCNLKVRFGGWSKSLAVIDLKYVRKKIYGRQRIKPMGASLLIADLKRVAAKNNQNVVTLKVYKEKGKYDIATIYRVLGGWKIATAKAGVKTKHEIPKEELLNDLKQVALLCKRNKITIHDYVTEGNHPIFRILSVFGKWKNALKEAGLQPSIKKEIL